LLQWSVVLSVSLAGAITDLRWRRIPNRLTVPALLLGLLMALLLHGIGGVADAAAASMLLSLPYVLLFAFAGGGAGDAKLMAALGSWLGLVNGVLVLLAVSIAGAAFAGAVLWRLSRATLGSNGQILERRARKVTVPYGVAICLGACVAATGSLLRWL
jgi:prepilin peptidase CpaA